MVACAQWVVASHSSWCNNHSSQEGNQISFPSSSCRGSNHIWYYKISLLNDCDFFFFFLFFFLVVFQIWRVKLYVQRLKTTENVAKFDQKKYFWNDWKSLIMQESGGSKIYWQFMMKLFLLEEPLMFLMLSLSMDNLVFFIRAQNQVKDS